MVVLPAPLLALVAIAAQRPVGLTLLAAAAVQLALWHSRPANPPAQRLRWDGDRLLLFESDTQAAEFRWRGTGRRSMAYIRLPLVQESTGLKHTLMLWRDSLDDPSWRTLNAYFRVHEAAVRREAQAD